MPKFGTHFTYLRNAKGAPVVAVALHTVEGSNKVQAQIATCNPRDQFDKKKARLALGGRLAKYPLVFDAPENGRHSDVINKFTKLLVDSDFAGVHAGPITKAVVLRYVENPFA